MTGERTQGTAIVTGAAGQDGSYLTKELLSEGRTVFACTRTGAALAAHELRGDLRVIAADLREPEPLFDLIRRIRPDEVFHLAGVSSVARSFADPEEAWITNATLVERLFECIRIHSPESHVYQASSTEIFGGSNDRDVVFDESSPLWPRSPYAAAKAAAQHLAVAYRESFGLRVACGILSNHESVRRPPGFLTRKIADHVSSLHSGSSGPLRLGNLKIERDWGYAADYTSGILAVARQTDVRSTRSGTPVADEAKNYREYILSTGVMHAVWQLADRAFALAGLPVVWHLEGDDPLGWRADFASGGGPAVVVEAALIRPSEPQFLCTDPSRAARELGWRAPARIDAFLATMIAAPVPATP